MVLSDDELFNPDKFRSGLYEQYTNKPFVGLSTTTQVQSRLEKAMQRPINTPYGLRHQANPPGADAVMGLAAYPRNMKTFRRLVGSLRHTGYDGHIILGVHSKIPLNEENFLIKMDVTMYNVEMVVCDESISTGGNVKGNIRGKCSTGLENLKLEWGRFEMARQWLNACKQCTGWSLVMDTRDLFFQAHPFKDLPSPHRTDADLLFIEEIAPHTCPIDDPKRSFISGNFRNKAHIVPCYGNIEYDQYSKRPVLCSGTVIGTREGTLRFLSVLVNEFHENNAKENLKCRSPSTTDQWTMNWLYYNGYFGYPERTKTIPWGTGPVQTVGKPCVNKENKPSTGAKDIVKQNENGLIVNIFDGKIAPVVHQFDRCHPWIADYFNSQEELFSFRGGALIPLDEIKPMEWNL